MTIFASTGRRRELGAELRRIREDRGYTGQDMARRLSWTTTMLSRAETGKRSMTDLEITLYMGLCDVSGEQLFKLLELAGEPDEYRIKAHPGQIPDELHSLIFHESTASAIDGFEPSYIPGILQTPEYIRALLEEGGLADPAHIGKWVEIRHARRVVLTRANPALCTIYVHEHALRMAVGGPQVMYEQLLHLVFATGRPQCSIRVVPASAGSRGMVTSPFRIFRYSDDPPMVYVQNETTSDFLESDKDLKLYEAVLNRLATVALNDAESRSFLANLAGEYERQGAADGVGGVAEE
jgi:transcriptional regulator with XRE-family HTH domain